MTANRLKNLSSSYTTWLVYLGFLMAIGALALGYSASTTEVCGAFSCDSKTDGATFAIVAAGYAIAGVVVLLPISGVAHLMAGLARVVEALDAGQEEPETGDEPDTSVPY